MTPNDTIKLCVRDSLCEVTKLKAHHLCHVPKSCFLIKSMLLPPKPWLSSEKRTQSPINPSIFQVLFLLLSLYATLTVGDHAPPFKPLHPSAYTKSPLMYPSFVPKHGIGLKPYMTQFRAGTRLAPVAIRPAPSMIMRYGYTADAPPHVQYACFLSNDVRVWNGKLYSSRHVRFITSTAFTLRCSTMRSLSLFFLQFEKTHQIHSKPPFAYEATATETTTAIASLCRGQHQASQVPQFPARTEHGWDCVREAETGT